MTIQQELDFPTFLTYGKETSRFGMWFQKVWVGDGNFLLLVSSLSDKTLALSRKTFSCPEEGFSQEKDHFGSFSIEQTHPGSFFQNDYPILGGKVSSKRCFHHFNRPEGCLLTYSTSKGFQTFPKQGDLYQTTSVIPRTGKFCLNSVSSAQDFFQDLGISPSSDGEAKKISEITH